MILNGGITFTGIAELILLFKARSWLDVFRLSVLLAPMQQVVVADTIKQDMARFLTAMEIEEGLDLENFGVTISLDQTLSNLRSIYGLET